MRFHHVFPSTPCAGHRCLLLLALCRRFPHQILTTIVRQGMNLKILNRSWKTALITKVVQAESSTRSLCYFVSFFCRVQRCWTMSRNSLPLSQSLGKVVLFAYGPVWRQRAVLCPLIGTYIIAEDLRFTLSGAFFERER